MDPFQSLFYFGRIALFLAFKILSMRNLLFVVFFLPLLTLAQKKQLTLEEIFKKPVFYGERTSTNSEQTTPLFNAADIKDETGKTLDTRDFEADADGKRILFFNGREPIYRRSTKATVYLYNVASKKTTRLNEGKILHPTFSPDGSKMAYVFENNLYLFDVASGNTTPVTTDGKWNYIINGNADWVYEEEFEFSRAFQWSPSGAYLAYYRFDESAVKEFNMTIYDDKYNQDYRFKYPKAGEANSKVEIHIYNVATAQDVKAQYDTGDIYIPRIKWMKAQDELVVFWMNRLQNELKLLRTNPATGAARLLYEEKNKWYVEINDDWQFLKDGYLFSSDMNGYKQLYYYSLDGKKKLQLSKLKYDLAEINAVDEKAGLVYYTLAYPTPMDRNFFVSDLSGKKSAALTTGSGTHSIEMNAGFTGFNDAYSTINTPQTVTRYEMDASKMRAVKKEVINENSKLKNTLSEYELSTATFIRVPNNKGDTLNGWMLKPTGFDSLKRYPVLFCNYGGPGSQQVANRFGAASMWHQLLAQHGYIVVSIDNTGTGFRGEEFKKKTYLQLGKLEIEDQIDAA